MRRVIKFLANFFSLVQNLFIPEDTKIFRLLSLKSTDLKEFLPRSTLLVKDVDVLFDYQNKAVQLLIKKFKYQNNREIKKIFASITLDRLIELSSDIALFHGDKPIIIPAPMSKNEFKERGFNQCEELLQEIMSTPRNTLDIRFDILDKVRETKRQAKLNKEQRFKNIYLSMIVRELAKEKIANKSFIFVDDVYTTGATFAEAKRALKAAKARSCYGVFLAH